MSAASSRPIPLVDLGAQHESLRPQIDKALARVVDSSGFILGAEVDAFEREMAAYLGATHAIGVANGTDAIHFALRGLGIGAGDEVILPSWTFIATASAVWMAGATPVFAEMDPATYHLDPAAARARITPRTKALIPVHLYGQALDLAPFRALAQEHGLKLIEDACQAHGARLGGDASASASAGDGGTRRAGAVSDAGCFSFYPSKNLGGIGDGGMIVTSDDALADRLRRLRNHGQARKYEHVDKGFTGRLDALQAAVLRVKLPHLDAWNDRRRAIAREYNAALAGLPLGLPVPAAGRDHVYHVYVVRTPRRADLARHLDARGIGTVIHYPTAVHEQKAFADAGVKPGELALSEAAGREVLSLPLYPEMTVEQVARVIDGVKSFFAA